ncbi:TlpA family protein disulfide reductase [Duganella callida]|uniref:Redoxin domain-containing protein n=1 Tax=Duganella callida TaxID=2561932 RepID=A0A4Y9SBY4_9BURK|nr:prolipoprotein diacylglyceryl transferase family protein [Duganella callida]TFW17172.1 redoxin domain-containing protein [Duganella callida]
MKLGPLLVPYTALLVLLTALVCLAMARYFDRRSERKIEATITWMLLIALAAARLFFVWRYRSLYLSSPLTILDIRDGGWDAEAGVIAAWVYALAQIHRTRAIRKAMLWTVGAASVVWIAGSLALFARTATQGSMPSQVLQDLQGRPVTIGDFRGKPTVINFWATWCPPCQKEMPAMAAVQAQRPDVNFVFVNQAEPLDTVVEFLTIARLSLKNVLLDPQQAVARDFQVMGYPTTLMFDASGKLVYQHMGALSEAALTQHLGEVATQPPGSLVK